MSLAGRLGSLPLLLALIFCARVRAEDIDRLRTAKALVFDHKYAEAREAWQAIRALKGPEAESAVFWMARCSEGLGEDERALTEFGEYLSLHPQDSALREEALTSRIRIAARLFKAGKKDRASILYQGLSDPSKTVRYYAALQLGSIGVEAGQAAVKVLRQIVDQERDPDLVDRARLYLIRLDPGALSAEAPPGERGHSPSHDPEGAPGRGASWVKLRIYKAGESKAEVSVNLPLALADILFKSLPEEARQGLKRKGYDADNFWERLKRLGPAQIVTIEGDHGERIQIWIE